MNSVFRHHSLTGQPGDVPESTMGADTGGFADPTDMSVPQWPGPDSLAVLSADPSPSVARTGAAQFSPSSSTSSTSSGAGPNPVPTIAHGSPGGLIINVSYDSTVTNLDTAGNAAYDPTLYANYISAVQTAVQYYESEVTSPITINMNFGWGEVGGAPIASGGLAASSTFTFDYTYAQLLAAVRASETTSAVQLAAVLSLPGSDPTGGATFQVSTAEAKALGLNTSYNGTDGSAGLDSSQKFFWSQSLTVSNAFDAVGAFEHEISEVLGRQDAAGVNNTYTLLDMFRYTAASGLSGAVAGSAVGMRDQPFVAGYSTTAPASAAAGLNSYSYFSYDGITITNQYDIPSQVALGADVADWASTVGSDSFGYSNQGQVAPVTTTGLQEINVLGYSLVACYLPDTRIATPSGHVAVQDLAVGDMVSTHNGEAKPITWIGQGKALATRGRRNAATPVIVRKGALDDNVPNYDLRITKGHALYLDGVLIPVEFLVNHRSIVWDDRAREVTVYHIELAVHAVLLANGAPAESYRDDGNRWLFANGNDGWHALPKPACAPVLTGGPVVDAVWKRVLDRSGPRPGLPLTDEPDLYLLVDGRRVDGRKRQDGVFGFRLPPHVGSVRLVSRAGAQDEMGLARDPRVLGVAVRQIMVWRGRCPTVIEADDPRLSDGFHAYEADNDFRWTDGDAGLPGSLFGDGLTGLDVQVAATTRYPLLGRTDVAAA